MANPTTNYSWPMPTSTDLVTDLPADFALFGQPVDTSLKALNPETTLGDIAYRSSTSNTNTRLGIGTNGQVLAVSSGVPAWTTTADVTPLTTKGDVFTFSTVDARIGVGANNTVLTADSAEATGLKWATPSSAVVPILTTAQPTGDFSTASTSFVDITNVTITRTPSSATNKIEVKFSFVCTVSTGLQLDLKCFAGATSLLQFSYEVEYNGGSPDTINAIWYATNVAASSTIFKVQAKVNTGTITFNGTNSGYANGFSTLEVY